MEEIQRALDEWVELKGLHLYKPGAQPDERACQPEN
jgi:hypothetical protein